MSESVQEPDPTLTDRPSPVTDRFQRPDAGMLDQLLENSQLGMALLDGAGDYQRVNDSLCRLLGRPRTELIGQNQRDFIAAGDGGRLTDALAGTSAGVQAEVCLRRPDDRLAWALATLTRLDSAPPAEDVGPSPDAHPATRWVAQYQDITELRGAREDHERQSSLLASVIDNAPIGEALITLEDRFFRVNRALCRIVGYSEPELLARRYQDIAVETELMLGADSLRQLVSGEIDHHQAQRHLRHHAGHTVPVRISVSLLRDAHGDPLHFIAQIEDVTERLAAETELRQALGNGEAILAAMAEGYALTVDAKIVAVNDRLCELTGFSQAELLGTTPPYPFWPPELGLENEALRERVISTGGGTFEMALMRTDGSRFDGEVTAQPARVPDGGLAAFVNTIRDVSARKSYEAEQEALREIAELVAASPDPAPAFEVITRTIRELFDARSSVMTRFNHELSRGEILYADTDDGHRLEGETFSLSGPTAAGTVFRTGAPVRTSVGADDAVLNRYYAEHGVSAAAAVPINVRGQTWGALAVTFPDRGVPAGTEERLRRFGHLTTLAISNAEAWDRLRHDAGTDALTGLANQRTFFSRLQEELSAAAEHGGQLHLSLIDLDHFKSVNDTFGHQAGDRVLQQVGRLIDDMSRDGDLAARIGGEEFALLMPRTGTPEAENLIEALRLRVAGHPFSDVGALTMSAGISGQSGPMTPTELMEAADQALYRAKNDGRNLVRLAG